MRRTRSCETAYTVRGRNAGCIMAPPAPDSILRAAAARHPDPPYHERPVRPSDRLDLGDAARAAPGSRSRKVPRPSRCAPTAPSSICRRRSPPPAPRWSATTSPRCVRGASRRRAVQRRCTARQQPTGFRCVAAAPARAVRPAGDQGRRRDLRRKHARARHRGAGARRRQQGRRDPRAHRRHPRRQPDVVEARLRRRGARQAGAGRARRVVAVSRGRHRPRRRGLHQDAADGERRPWRADRAASRIGVEQSRAGDRAGGQFARHDPGRDARQRRQPARLRGPQRAAAVEGEGQQRVVLDRPVHPAVRRRFHARRRPPVRARARCLRRRRFPSRRPQLDAQDQPRSRRSRRTDDQRQPPVSRRLRAVHGHDVRAGQGSRRTGRGLYAPSRATAS